MDNEYDYKFTEVVPKTQKRKLFLNITGFELIYLFLCATVCLIPALTIKWDPKSLKMNYGINLTVAFIIFCIFGVMMILPANAGIPNFKLYHRIFYFIKFRFKNKRYVPNSKINNTEFLNAVSHVNTDSDIREAREFIVLTDSSEKKTSKSFCFGIEIEGVDFTSQSNDSKDQMINKFRNLIRNSECKIQIIKYVSSYDASKQSKYIEELKVKNDGFFKNKEITEKRHGNIDVFLNQVLKRYDSNIEDQKNLVLVFQANNERDLVEIKNNLKTTLFGINFQIMTPYQFVNVCQKMFVPWELDFDENEVARAIEKKDLKKLLTINQNVEIKSDCIKIDDIYYKFGCISQFPDNVQINWLDFLLYLPVNFSMRIGKIGSSRKRSYINVNKKNIRISHINTGKDDELARAELEQKNELMDDFITSLTQGNETLHDMGIYIMMQSLDFGELKTNWSRMQNDVLNNEMMLDSMANRQLEGFTQYAIKTNTSNSKFSNTFISSKGVALSYPFTNERLDHEQGGDYGYIVNTGDRFVVETFHPTGKDYVNNHELGFGTSGAGKTLTILIKIDYSLAEGNYCVLLDPDNEFLRFGKNMDAEMIDLGSPSQILNPWDVNIPIAQDEIQMSKKEIKDWYLQEHLMKLQTFHRQLFPDFDTNVLVLMTKLMAEFYKEWKPWINQENLSVISPNSSPTYTDFIKFLKSVDHSSYYGQEDIFQKLYNRFSSVFLENGVYNNKLNKKSTLAIGENKLTILNLKTLLDSSDKNLRNSLFFLMFGFVNQLVTKNRYENDENLPRILSEYGVSLENAIKYFKRTAIFVDEAHKLWIDNEVPKKQIFDWYKVLRKYSAKVSCWTQNIKDFIGAGEKEKQLTSGIFKNSQYINILTLNSDEEFQLANEMFASNSSPLTSYEKEFILEKKAGSCLFMATQTKRYMVQYEVPKKLMEMKIDG